MRMKRIGLTIISFYCVVSLIQAQLDNMRFLSLSTNDGLSQMSVLQIVQDSDGFLWFGTRNGLNRYNGYDFEVFKFNSDNSETISDNHISSLCEGVEATLWVGTMNGLNRMDRNKGTFERDFSSTITTGAHFPEKMHIFSLFFDTKGCLWIGAGPGLYIYDTLKNNIVHLTLGGLLDNNPVRSIAEDRQGNIYLGTTYGGMLVVDGDFNLSARFINEADNDLSLSENFVSSIYFDSNEQLWVGTRYGGLNLFDLGQKTFRRYTKNNSGLSNNEIRCIEEDGLGNLIIGTFGGLNVLNKEDDQFTVYNRLRQAEGGLSHFSIYSVLYDHSGILWIGSYSGGINYFYPYNYRFRFHDPSLPENSLFGTIGPMVEKDHLIYIATEGGGLLKYHPYEEKYRYYFIEEGDPVPYYENIIKSLFLDGDVLWCGTAMGKIYSFDLRTNTFTKRYNLERSDVIYTLFKDQMDNLFVGSVGTKGLIKITPKGEYISEFPLQGGESVSFHNVRAFYPVDAHSYLIGTRNDGLFFYDSKTLKLIPYADQKESTSEYITSIVKMGEESYWIGFFGGGIAELDLNNGYSRNFDLTNGMPDDKVCSMLEGRQGMLWISTLTGLVEFDTQKELFRNYTFESGIKVNEFSLHASLKRSNGHLYFSGNNGFISFNPEDISPNPFLPPVYLTELTVNNRPVVFSDGNPFLERPLSLTDQITLKYDEANFTLSYVALNYIFPERNHYAYRLDGFDEEWIDAKRRRTAFYTNIPPGDYVFRVKAANNDGAWNEEGTQIRIKVLPPFWKSAWAMMGYVVLFVSLLVGLLRHFKMKETFKNDLHRKQIEKQAVEDFHKERMQLFTNFSHELRTPLTLIYAPLQDLLTQPGIEAGMKTTLNLIFRNAERLMNLVNQLMDFRKREDGKLELSANRNNYALFIEEMMLAFSVLAKKRNIQLVFDGSQVIKDSLFDADLMEKVFFNLLSNAFKNVQDGGQIVVSLKMGGHPENQLPAYLLKAPFAPRSDSFVYINISDNGIGVPAESLQRIFDPFYQLRSKDSAINPGTGLGLSLSKGIVEMHDGLIWAESISGEGATFRLILPFLDAAGHAEKSEIGAKQSESSFVVEDMVDKSFERDVSPNRGTVLIVEDNREVRAYLVQLLQPFYLILQAQDGQVALEVARKRMPDLILSDIMMPVMDGVEFCLKLKQDLAISHIPVIMITARSSFAHIQEGFQSGADDYITKPFSSDLLLLKVKNMLATRERMKALFSKRFSSESLGISVVSADEGFMQKMSEFIQTNLSNPDLNIDLFCREVGVSRANLYRKMKALTGLSANEYIRNIRLETGARLLKETDLTVAEVSERVGFNSPAYFSSCFKSLYKIAPKDY